MKHHSLLQRTAPLLAGLMLSTTLMAAGAGHDEGQALYRAYCAQCHGLLGDSWGVNSYTMDVAPRDHTDTDEMAARTDEELFKVIKHGGKAINKSVLMPPWGGNLSDREINVLLRYLRTLCCGEKS